MNDNTIKKNAIERKEMLEKAAALLSAVKKSGEQFEHGTAKKIQVLDAATRKFEQNLVATDAILRDAEIRAAQEVDRLDALYKKDAKDSEEAGSDESR